MVEQKELPEETEFCKNRSRLIELSKKPRIDDGAERNERDELLRYFRRKGYMSEEISEFTEERLTERWIAKITQGTEVEDSALKARIEQLINKMVLADIGFGRVRVAVQIKNDLDANGVAFEDVSSFLAEVAKTPATIGGLNGIIAMYKEMKDQQPALTFSRVRELLDYKKEIEEAGIQTLHLKQISQVAEKYNRDISQVMEVLGSFESIESAREKVGVQDKLAEKANDDRKKAEDDAKNAMTENAHLRDAIALCRDMIIKYGFTKAALKDIFELAKKCGNPLEVMNVLAQYQDLTQGIKNLSDQKTELGSKVRELDNNARTLRAESEAIRESITGLLNPVSTEIGQAFKDAVEKITNEYDAQISRLREAAIEYGRKQEAVEILADDLKMVKAIRALAMHPQEADKVPIGFAFILLVAARNILLAKGDNSKIKKWEAHLVEQRSIQADEEVEARVLVSGAILALESKVATVSGGQ